MGKFCGYRCSLCGSEFDVTDVYYTCPKDGGNLDVLLDYVSIQRKHRPGDLFGSTIHSLWRYLPLLPVEDPGGASTPLHAVGYTPQYSLPLLKERLGIPRLWIKDESRNPTASFKDRASAIVVARAQQIGTDIVVTASTGNAGAALAGMAAAAGHRAIIFAPRSAPSAKIAQLLIYGAQVLLIDGSYDQAFDLSIEASKEFGWYCRNTGYNPFTAEGKKTAAYEVWEWWEKLPDMSDDKPLSIFVSVGDGNIISGIHKGFKDLIELGWMDSMPRLFGVQAEGSAAVANAFIKGAEIITPVHAQTLADSISVDMPRDGVRALRAVRQTGGVYITVADGEILQAMAELGKAGIFAEPAGATAYAGLRRALHLGLIDTDEPVLVINTGNGLKDVRAAMQAVGEVVVIEPTIQAVRRVIK